VVDAAAISAGVALTGTGSKNVLRSVPRFAEAINWFIGRVGVVYALPPQPAVGEVSRAAITGDNWLAGHDAVVVAGHEVAGGGGP